MVVVVVEMVMVLDQVMVVGVLVVAVLVVAWAGHCRAVVVVVR